MSRMLAVAVVSTALVSSISWATAQTPPADCASLIPGTPLDAENPAAPGIVDLGATPRVEITILGHSENRGYHPFLQTLLDTSPPLPGVAFSVQNRFIGGHEAWRWATPGERGHRAIDAMLQSRTAPLLVLGLFSNNVTFPIRTPDASDPGYLRLIADLEAIADHCHDNGRGAAMVYLSSHRYKPGNFAAARNERPATEAMIRGSGRSWVKAGPEQHDLHWCCFPDCYASDRAHTNEAGDRLMAEAWYHLLFRELTGCYSEPYGAGTAGSGGFVPVLQPDGGFPRAGNVGFGIVTSDVLGGAPLLYLVGFRRPAGPLLVDPVVSFPATAGGGGGGAGAGGHRLGLSVPDDPTLHSVVLRVQVGARDPAGRFFGFALSRGLEVAICR